MFVILHVTDSCSAMHLLKTGFQAHDNWKKIKKNKLKNFCAFLREKMFVEKWLKIIARKTGPTSPCKVKTFGVFCTKPSSHFLCQGSVQVQKDLSGKGWLMVPLGKRGDPGPCPAGGWDVGVRPCADGGTGSMRPCQAALLPLARHGWLQPTQEGWDGPHAPGESQGFLKHLHLLQHYFNRTLPSAGTNPWRKDALAMITAVQGQAGSQGWYCTTWINISSRGFTEPVCHGQRLCRAATLHTLQKRPWKRDYVFTLFPKLL